MNSLLVRNFLELRNNLDEKEYLLFTIAYNIAPTLMRVKPATLINISKDSRNSYEMWEMNRELICHKLKVKAYELKKTKSNIFILFYNNEMLSNVLRKEENKEFLSGFCYSINEGIEAILNKLKKNFREVCPNEIGIFLGIPLKDVEEYIKNMGKNYRLLSYWKVYNDEEKAKLIFSLYERSKELVIINILNKKELG